MKIWSFLPHFWFITIVTYVASNSRVFYLTFDSYRDICCVKFKSFLPYFWFITIGAYLASNYRVFATLLIHNYRDICCIKFRSFFASILIHNNMDICFVKFWIFLPFFWFITIARDICSIKFRSFCKPFDFLTTGSFDASNSGVFCLTFDS